MSAPLPEQLSDGVVTVRAMRIEDAGPYSAAFRDDPHLGRLLGAEADPDEASARARFERQLTGDGELTALQLAIADPESDAFWGSIIVHSIDLHNRHCELGFWVAPAQRRRGIGGRAVSLVISWAFEDLDMLRVEMTTTPENPAVPDMARRLGFTQEGVLRSRNIERGQRVDIIWFGLLREEWDGDAA